MQVEDRDVVLGQKIQKGVGKDLLQLTFWIVHTRDRRHRAGEMLGKEQRH